MTPRQVKELVKATADAAIAVARWAAEVEKANKATDEFAAACGKVDWTAVMDNDGAVGG